MLNETLIADFVISTIEERDFELGKALDTAKYKASRDRKQGVVVTRHDFCRFTVSLTENVPYGMIRERDHARRN